MNITFKKLSSLEKVFLTEEPNATCSMVKSIFKNETFSYQIAYFSEDQNILNSPYLKINVEDDFGGCVKIRSVGNVPSELPGHISCRGDDYITLKPGLFPDPLYNLENKEVRVVLSQWRSIWVDFVPNEGTLAGNYDIKINFLASDGTAVGCVEHTVEVIDSLLPKQELIHTQWFHYDCIGTYYGLEMLSEKHWNYFERYIRTAVKHGINMLLTPIFTPPLDTKIGGERPTVQLVGVNVINGKYSFDFTKLKKFVDMCLEIGVEYFEISHLFTQWGAAFAPKVVANVDGVEKRIFGWETKGNGPEYTEFLNALLPELIMTLEAWGIKDKCWFHISDEPSLSNIEGYAAAKSIVEEHLKDCNIMDALSDFNFYEKGLVKTPIPANNHIDPFLNADIKGLWTYYCCSQGLKVSNRFFSMPSRRNRILATQLYKYDISGFLQWGYNFWYSQYSIKPINPYCVTDAGCAFPSGDAFMVYPGVDGYPVESIRLMVFSEALCDLRAMKLLESLTSKDYVMKIIEEDGKNPITFSEYPRYEQYIIDMRNKINEEIKARI